MHVPVDQAKSFNNVGLSSSVSTATGGGSSTSHCGRTWGVARIAHGHVQEGRQGPGRPGIERHAAEWARTGRHMASNVLRKDGSRFQKGSGLGVEMTTYTQTVCSCTRAKAARRMPTKVG